MNFKEFQLVSRRTERGFKVTIERAKPLPGPDTSFQLSEGDRQRLIEAVSGGQLRRAELILRNKFPGLVKDDEGVALILRASCKGDVNMVDLLIANHAGFQRKNIDATVLEITKEIFSEIGQ